MLLEWIRLMPTSTRFAVAVHALAALTSNAGKPLRSEDRIRLLDLYEAVEDSELFVSPIAGQWWLRRPEPNQLV
ncbi:hypothetical protein EYW47_00905 [Paraburkholderia silviterrae]|uniref:Uncharacterized protein n=1 Tax=Paraburkholderia silviterrae TaxID=2528715 RepID=A0A4R5MGE3_9BURK|nr:hypothetical protein EYW47_00905 [Paraburkholderia silviterrae]